MDTILTAKQIESIFNTSFLSAYNTKLIGGYKEPLYLPTDDKHPHHRICYREDFIASALHEVAHWCIAGYERRQQIDYGYWYAQDGRSRQQQAEFFNVEIKPQALEKLFSSALKIPFTISLDNLNSATIDKTETNHFFHQVSNQAQAYLDNSLPKRAAIFYQALLRCSSIDHQMINQHEYV